MGMTPPPRLNNVKKTALFLHGGFPYSPKFLILENLDKFLTLLQFVSAWFIQVIKIIGSILYLGTYFGKFGVIQWFSKAHRSKLPKVNPKWRQNKQTRI